MNFKSSTQIVFIFLVIFISKMLLPSCSEPIKQSESLINGDSSNLDSIYTRIDINDFIESANVLKPQRVIIEYDHILKTKKTYLGYPIKDLLLPLITDLHLNNQNDILITFVCKDGYKPNQYLNDILENDGYLVFKDFDAKGNKNWPDSIESKFSPYYVVWNNLPVEDRILVWPYGIESIEISVSTTKFDKITPNDESVLLGFQKFKDNCLLCHSINKIGGTMGPEFNYPKNILEYWRVEDVWHYARNPQSYRYNSKMHKVNLSRSEFDEIVKYLNHMKNNKINN